MQYEIAHCRHATEGAVSRLWYTMSWLEEKSSAWALDSPADPPPSPWQQGRGGGAAVARYIHTTARSWDQTSESESRMTTVHFRIGEDSWHLNHRCRSVLDDQSYAAVFGRLRRRRGRRQRGHTDEGEWKRYQKCPFRYKHEYAVTV